MMISLLTQTDKEVIKAFAENDMNTLNTSKQVYLTKPGVRYHLMLVKAKTGLNPYKFYDLVKLLKLIGVEL